MVDQTGLADVFATKFLFRQSSCNMEHILTGFLDGAACAQGDKAAEAHFKQDRIGPWIAQNVEAGQHTATDKLTSRAPLNQIIFQTKQLQQHQDSSVLNPKSQPMNRHFQESQQQRGPYWDIQLTKIARTDVL